MAPPSPVTQTSVALRAQTSCMLLVALVPMIIHLAPSWRATMPWSPTTQSPLGPCLHTPRRPLPWGRGFSQHQLWVG